MSLSMQISEADLPMLSAVATQAIGLINQCDVTNQQLNDLIRQDPSLVSRIMHIANSPFYGGRFQARKISDAIVRMGMRQLRNILVLAATGELFDVKDPIIRGLWDHAMAVAAVSDRLAVELDIPESEEAFIGGLLHDIGKFIIYRQHPEAYAAMIGESEAVGSRLVDIELREFQYFTHVSVGGIVVNKWRLSEPVVEAARFHHQFEKAVPEQLSNRSLVAIVSLANVLVHSQHSNVASGNLNSAIGLACTQHLRLTPERVLRLCETIAPLCSPQDAPDAMEA